MSIVQCQGTQGNDGEVFNPCKMKHKADIIGAKIIHLIIILSMLDRSMMIGFDLFYLK